MIKTLLALSGAVLLAAPSLHAQSGARSFGPAASGSHFAPSAARGNLAAARHPFYGDAARYRHGGGHGHYYYYGGIPYFYDPFFYGAGYYGGFGGYGFGYGGPYGYGTDAVYDGRIADDRQNGDRPAGPTGSLPTAVQHQLSKRGYYKGSVDGKFGPASKDALSRFQHDNDLDETGRINEPTLKALGFEDHR